MRVPFILIFAILTLSLCSNTNAQLWKKYSDSAQRFKDKMQFAKAIEYFIKADKNLSIDSAVSATRAQILIALGNVYSIMALYKQAESVLVDAKNINQKLFGKDINYAVTCTLLGDLFRITGNYDKAGALLSESKELLKKITGKNDLNYALSCNNLGCLYWYTSEYDKAEPLLLEAKEIREKILGNKSADYAATCATLANLYWNMGQRIKAEALCLEAKTIREKIPGKQSPDYAYSCFDLGGIYRYNTKYKESEALLLEARNILKNIFGSQHPDYALSCSILGNLYKDMGKYDQAIALYTEARQINAIILGKESPEYEILCTSLGSLYRTIGDYKKALTLLEEAKKIAEKVVGKLHPDYAEIINNLGSLYWFTGQYNKAELLFSETREIWEKKLGKESGNYAQTTNTLGDLNLEIGKYEKAETLYLEAKQIRQKLFGTSNADYAQTCNSLGVLYKYIGSYKKSEELLLESKKIREELLGTGHPDYAASCNNLANVYVFLKDYDKAQDLYIEAKDVWLKTMGKHYDYALVCNNLGDLYRIKGEYDNAEKLIIESKEIREKQLGKKHMDYATSCMCLGLVYFSEKKYQKAIPLFNQAKEILKINPGKEYADYVFICDDLGDLYWIIKDFKKTYRFYLEGVNSQQGRVNKIFDFTSEQEKKIFLDGSVNLAHKFLSFAYKYPSYFNKATIFNACLFNRNLVLTSAQLLRRSVYNTKDSNNREKFNEWLALREQLSYLITRSIPQHEVQKNLEEKINSLEKELTRLSSVFKGMNANQNTSWKNIQLSMNLNEAAIEFAEFNYYDGKRWTDSTFYVGLVLRKDKPEPIFVRLFEKKQLDIIFNSPENFSINNKINFLYKQSSSLYNLVWKPLEKHLSGISKVYFASAGDLFKISFAALSINNKQLLSDKYQLVQLNTTATVVNKDKTLLGDNDNIQLYGGINYDADSTALKQAAGFYQSNTETKRSLPDDLKRGSGFQYLPGTQQEADEINKQAINAKIPVTILNGTNATEESIKALAENASPSVLHIATHGFFFPDPKKDKEDDIQRRYETSGKVFKKSDNPLFRSGLLFAGANYAWNGKPLEGIEDGILTAYEVSNMYLPNTKLVVLSACETALGDIQGSEGVYGLQRAFKMAGAQYLVMSLWKVPDEETAEFMQLFYKNLFVKQSISTAFYNAQQVMKNKYRTEPYKWAAWVLMR